jgi:hypothetical protein
MKAIVSLIFIIMGLILLSLDRLLDKNKVIEIDKRMEGAITKIRFKRKHMISFNLFIINLFIIYITIKSGKALPYKWILIILVIGLILDMVIGGYIGVLYYIKNKNMSNKLSLFKLIFIMIIYSPILTLKIYLKDLVRLALFLLINPLQGIVFLNKRYLNSFSGLIGLILTIIGTIFQFL